MPTMPIFPLGSALLPAMPLPLRVFEQRYLVMLERILQHDSAEFGVVLIERGQEVGGGDQRFAFGTVAQVQQARALEGYLALVCLGGRRFRVTEWLEDDPFPQAEVEDVPELVWDPAWQPDLEETERAVRRTLAVASEFTEQVWSAEVELEEDPALRCWQLAGITPVGPLDHQRLLASESFPVLLEATRTACAEATETLRAPWPEDPDPT